jgi:hypothetical protein
LVGGQGGESMEPQAGVGDDEARPLSKGT